MKSKPVYVGQRSKATCRASPVRSHRIMQITAGDPLNRESNHAMADNHRRAWYIRAAKWRSVAA